VSHFGESFGYGPATIDPAAAARPWVQPHGRLHALDHVLTSTPLGPLADQHRIGALGHSSGGATVLQLGGALFDPAAMQRHCASSAARLDRGCDYGRGLITSRPTSGHTTVIDR
jgi:predicted dienelactone hydrolase